MNSRFQLSRVDFDAVIFDLDGVVTQTAAVHAAAWKKLFDDFLGARAAAQNSSFIPFDAETDYLRYVDGKPRLDGIRSFLESRQISLPPGSPDDSPDTPTIHGLARRKNQFFLAHLAENGAETYPSTISLIQQLRQARFRVAIVSASKNCTAVLQAAGVENFFEVRVDGNESERLHLAGKPAPDIFLEAARRLGVPPNRAAIVEDSLAGVEAGRAGNFGCVIGVDRANQATELAARGATVVVGDLAEISVQRTRDRRISDLPDGMKSLELIGEIPPDRVVVFLDYDGTLSPIVERPEDANLDPAVRQGLQKLAEHCTVAVVSGRDLADVRARVGMENLIYAGSHGFDIAGPNGLQMIHERAEEFLPILDAAENELVRELSGIEGAQIERKKFTIAIHYRRVSPEAREQVKQAVDRVGNRHPNLRQGIGKMVLELQPKIDWHKGKAILWLLDALQLDSPETLPIYIGDDVTDEDAFDALPIRGIGIAVKGGDHPTSASYSLENTSAVHAFIDRLTAQLSVGSSASAWTLAYDGFHPAEEQLREALCTLGNGYFATRGAAPESSADGIHYPGTYLAGGYNRLVSRKAGRDIVNEDLVNLPNWLPLHFRIAGSDWFDLARADLLHCRQELHLRSGILVREIRFRDSRGRETFVRQRRLVHMKHPRLAALETVVRAENWSGKIKFRTALDGQVENSGVPRYRGLNAKHLLPRETRLLDEDTVFLKVETSQSEIRIAQAARTRIYRTDSKNPLQIPRETREEPRYIEQTFVLPISSGEEIRVEKIVALATSRDQAISEPGLEAAKWVARAGRFDELLQSHALAWKHLWRRFNIEISPNNGQRTNLILRLHAFHLLQTVSLHTLDLDVGVPSRGWHGEAYRGHIFWDELFIFPFFNLRLPEITRKLLLYRYRRLDEARHAAKDSGYRGAMFPWQSGSDGREETQTVHLNPASGRWIPDNSHRQRHVNVAIAYNIWQYWQATADSEFLIFHGAEMFLEIARFLASLATENPETGRFDIAGVMGPDEYHDALPNSSEPGLRNNAYTNIMVSWVLKRVPAMLDLLPEDRRDELRELLDFRSEEIQHWQKIASHLTIPFHDGDVISQFEGYENLKELDWETYREKHGKNIRLDRILEAEGDSPNNYKASKQADVVMLFYLLPNDELKTLFHDLGYTLTDEIIRKNIDYYLQRTSHGSTLSQIVHSWVTARFDRSRAWELFLAALESDIADVQGGTTGEGIHLGAMAGTIDLLQRCFTGIETRGETLHLNPNLPAELREIRLRLRYRGHTLVIEIRGPKIRVQSLHSSEHAIAIAHRDQHWRLSQGTILEFTQSP